MAEVTEMRPVDDLHLDHRNPRLPEEFQELPQEELVCFVADEYDSLRIARSVAQFGYFPSEPLIVVEEDGVIIVVEGNRRLAALKLLNNADLRDCLAVHAFLFFCCRRTHRRIQFPQRLSDGSPPDVE